MATISVTLPADTELPYEDYYLQNGLFVSTLLNQWFSFDLSNGNRYHVWFRKTDVSGTIHGWDPGSGSFAHSHLTSSTGIPVTLNSGSITSGSVATAVSTVLSAQGYTVSVTANTCSFTGATLTDSVTFGPNISTANTASIWGMWDIAQTGQGTVPGTLLMHIQSPSYPIRIRGLQIHCGDTSGGAGAQFRAGIASGSAYPTFGTFTTLIDFGRGSTARVNSLETWWASEPVLVSASSDLYILVTDFGDGSGNATVDTRGQITVRGSGGGRIGNFAVENLYRDNGGTNTSLRDPDQPYSASFTPDLDFNVAVVINARILYDAAPFRGDGGLNLRFGTQISEGINTPLDIDIDNDCLTMRADTLEIQGLRLNSISVDVSGSGDPWECAVYQFYDYDLPSSTSGTLLRTVGQISMSAAGYNSVTLSPPLEIGTEVLGTGSILALAFNGGDGGGTSAQIRYDDGANYTNGSPDTQPNTWRYRAEDNSPEYETLISGNMPVNGNSSWPAVFLTHATDTEPGNFPRMYYMVSTDNFSSSFAATVSSNQNYGYFMIG